MKVKTNRSAIDQENEGASAKTTTANTMSTQGRSINELTGAQFSEEKEEYSDFDIEGDYLMLFDS
ncbi:MAG: hypothetical protein QHC79_04000 [Pseudosphingobacterium sp.]|nr:hypothetical protein [Olivibacter sp. UJ_SKK_5.1]MDX3912676.1 hypothetical protein [Pseudosphingobacterium sp.]